LRSGLPEPEARGQTVTAQVHSSQRVREPPLRVCQEFGERHGLDGFAKHVSPFPLVQEKAELNGTLPASYCQWRPVSCPRAGRRRKAEPNPRSADGSNEVDPPHPSRLPPGELSRGASSQDRPDDRFSVRPITNMKNRPSAAAEVGKESYQTFALQRRYASHRRGSRNTETPANCSRVETLPVRLREDADKPLPFQHPMARPFPAARSLLCRRQCHDNVKTVKKAGRLCRGAARPGGRVTAMRKA